MSTIINVPGVFNAGQGAYHSKTAGVYDETQQKLQSVINSEVKSSITDLNNEKVYTQAEWNAITDKETEAAKYRDLYITE